MMTAKKVAKRPTSATRQGRAKTAAMKGPMARNPTMEILPPETAKMTATADTQTRATSVAVASARSARRLFGLVGRSSSIGSGTFLSGLLPATAGTERYVLSMLAQLCPVRRLSPVHGRQQPPGLRPVPTPVYCV